MNRFTSSWSPARAKATRKKCRRRGATNIRRSSLFAFLLAVLIMSSAWKHISSTGVAAIAFCLFRSLRFSCGHCVWRWCASTKPLSRIFYGIARAIASALSLSVACTCWCRPKTTIIIRNLNKKRFHNFSRAIFIQLSVAHSGLFLRSCRRTRHPWIMGFPSAVF